VKRNEAGKSRAVMSDIRFSMLSLSSRSEGISRPDMRAERLRLRFILRWRRY
jgi:hypothetical protein